LNTEVFCNETYFLSAIFLVSKSDFVLIADSGSDSGINGKDDQRLLSEEEEEERRIAELGKPRLGQYPSVEILIEESYEFKVRSSASW